MPPISPEEMEAFANKGGGPPPAAVDEEGGDGGNESQDEGGDRFANLKPLLQEFAEDIEECCDELDGEALTDVSLEMDPQDMQILQEGINEMDRRLKKEFQNAGRLSEEDARMLANELEQEGKIEDADRVAGYLFRVSSELTESSDGGDEGGDEGGNGGEEGGEGGEDEY